MMYMVMMVLDDPNRLDEMLDAWETVGVSGVTIIESTGINRRRRQRLAGSVLMAGFNRLISSSDESHFTLFVIVPDESLVQACLEAAEKVVGDFDQPNTGVLAAWPVSYVKGVPPAAITPRGEP
ncbi:MAG: hypothetical protein IT297_04490 [Anaerolineae bacterium]|jgi:nitrogen regulatory protein PII|nr:hypothetical protein [Anaerolineae bacterium]MCZ7553577.1 hypothetical protein [Anaerolineales bacterium]